MLETFILLFFILKLLFYVLKLPGNVLTILLYDLFLFNVLNFITSKTNYLYISFPSQSYVYEKYYFHIKKLNSNLGFAKVAFYHVFNTLNKDSRYLATINPSIYFSVYIIAFLASDFLRVHLSSFSHENRKIPFFSYKIILSLTYLVHNNNTYYYRISNITSVETFHVFISDLINNIKSEKSLLSLFPEMVGVISEKQLELKLLKILDNFLTCKTENEIISYCITLLNTTFNEVNSFHGIEFSTLVKNIFISDSSSRPLGPRNYLFKEESSEISFLQSTSFSPVFATLNLLFIDKTYVSNTLSYSDDDIVKPNGLGFNTLSFFFNSDSIK
jgi:hypothetical protein